MTDTAKVVNTSPVVVLDGGGKVTLSGAGQRRILYMNTCDQAQIWTTSHCQNQDHPQLTIQGIDFTHGNSTGEPVEGGGGGAVFVRGGRVKVVDSVFTANRCDPTGPDLGGAALRVLSQYEGLPVIVATSTFSRQRVLERRGALEHRRVVADLQQRVHRQQRHRQRRQPARAGTPGGGSGGAIYLDGNLFTLDLAGSIVRDNTANEGGGAIFFVSNNRTGELRITTRSCSTTRASASRRTGFPGIFFLGAGAPQVPNSTIS